VTEQNGRVLSGDDLRIRAAEEAYLGGKLDAAAEMASGDILSPEVFSVRGILAFLDGRRAEALDLFETGLKRLRKEQRSRKVCYETFSGVFHPLLLLAGGEFKKASAYLSAGMEKSPYSSLYALFRFLADYRGKGSGSFFSVYSPKVLEKQGYSPSFLFFAALCVTWSAPERLDEYRPLFEKALDRLREMGKTHLLATELGEILGLPVENPVARDLPLHGILPRRENWMLALSALSALGETGETEKKRARRILWEADWESGEDGIIRSVSFTPLEQVLQPSGNWSKGRPVALKRLRNDLVREDWMTRQDTAAAGAVRETSGYEGWYYRRWFEFDQAKILKALAGHPSVVRADDGRPVEIVAEPPSVETEFLPSGVLLRMAPHPSEGPFQGLVAVEEGPERIRAVVFEEKHLEIARILGEKGIPVPPEGKGEALRALEALAPLVPVSSGLDGPGNLPGVPADERIYIQLAPGGEGFTAAFSVRPLGPGTPAGRPGTGGKAVFGLSGGKRMKALRSLDEEIRRADEVRLLCPALGEGEQTDDYRWILDSPELCLDFLLQAGELGDRAVIEWPRGDRLSIRGKAGASSVRASVRSVKDWFALTGEIRVDEETVVSLREACRMISEGGSRFLPLGNGEFLALTEELRRGLWDLATAGDWKGTDLRFSPLSAPLVERLTSGADNFSGDGEWHRRLALAAEAERLNPDLPAAFRGELRDYQADGYRWLLRLAAWGAGACLADDMGLGKTVQVLVVLLARGSGGPALVVAPVSVCPNWAAEAARFAPSLSVKEYRNGDRKKLLEELGPFDVVTASYGLLQHDGALLESVGWHTVVLDEAQAIKNSGTKRSAAAMKLGGDFRVITTGTPVENNLGELWNLFRFLNPGLLGSLDGFTRRFAVPIEKYGNKGAAARLKKLVRPFLLRRTKDQVLSELPPKTEIVLRVEMTREERAVYEAVRREATGKIESGGDGRDKRFVVLAELMRLRRACCSPSLVLPEKAGLPSSRLEAFGEILEELRAGGHRCLVFSQFVDHLSIIREYLDGLGVSYAYLDGSTPSRERERQIASFQGGEKECFLISLRAGGTGLNLTAADYVIHMDPWWNPAVEDQASDRAHRIGQERPVTVYRIVAKDTVEEKIVDLHGIKRELAESLLEGAEGAARISMEEMAALIRDDRTGEE